MDETLLVRGPPGVGKSTLVQRVAAVPNGVLLQDGENGPQKSDQNHSLPELNTTTRQYWFTRLKCEYPSQNRLVTNPALNCAEDEVAYLCLQLLAAGNLRAIPVD